VTWIESAQLPDAPGGARTQTTQRAHQSVRNRQPSLPQDGKVARAPAFVLAWRATVRERSLQRLKEIHARRQTSARSPKKDPALARWEATPAPFGRPSAVIWVPRRTAPPRPGKASVDRRPHGRYLAARPVALLQTESRSRVGREPSVSMTMARLPVASENSEARARTTAPARRWAATSRLEGSRPPGD
jgi:hypothetical protein